MKTRKLHNNVFNNYFRRNGIYIRFAVIVFILLSSLMYANAQVHNNGDTIFVSDNTTLYIKGDFKNTDNGSFYPHINNDGIINLGGDFTATVNTYYKGHDTLLLSGSGSQGIAGERFQTFIVSGAGTKTFTSDAEVNISCNILNGNINTGIFTLFLDSMATISEDETNYLTGKVQMTKYLSQGKTDTFGGMGIEINAANFNPCMTSIVRTTGYHLSGNGYQSIQRYYDITPGTNGLTGSTIVLHYFDHELNSIVESDLAVYRKRVIGNWEYDGFTIQNSTGNTVTAKADTLGKITLGSILHPLPVELLEFNAKLISDNTSLLDWKTASESNNDHFDIERSEDGKHFVKISEVKGSGTSTGINYYSYTDNFGSINGNILYYRLKQVDYNGKYEYSEIRKLNLTAKNETTFKAWYNSESGKIESLIHYEDPANASIRLIDMQGKLIAEKNISFPAGTSNISLDCSGLAQGIYTLSLQDEKSALTRRILIH